MFVNELFRIFFHVSIRHAESMASVRNDPKLKILSSISTENQSTRLTGFGV